MSGLYDAVKCCFLEDEWNLIKRAVNFHNTHMKSQYKSKCKKRAKEEEESKGLPKLRIRKPLKPPVEINVNDYISEKCLVKMSDVKKIRKEFVCSMVGPDFSLESESEQDSKEELIDQLI